MIKRFSNGNMNCKMEKTFYDNRESGIVNLIRELQDCDCDILGEEYCLSNYDMAIDIYSYYFDKKYCLSYSDIEKWKTGKTIKLYAVEMTEEDYEELNKF